ncbi:MAG: rod shape-determining protein RodA [Bacteroidales bacterium]|nr:rod shape-determining protein RodA [Bacteroidales bacterium]
MRNKKGIYNIDKVSIILFLVLVFLGWINIYAAVYNEDHNNIFDLSQKYGKQLIWIGASIILGVIILMIDVKFFSTFSYLIYGISIVSLIAVLIIGKEIAGSRSWFQIGGFGIQPAEFAKFATNLALAKFLTSLNINLKNFKFIFKALIIIGIPAFLILLQYDAGSALVYTVFILVLYREGLSGSILIIGVIVAAIFIFTLLLNKFIVIGIIISLTFLIFLLFKNSRKNIIPIIGLSILMSLFAFSVDYAFENALENHQKKRINVLLGIEKDLHGAGYNVNQSKIAIGSGGLTGKGFLKGTQTKYNFVPEQSTDFIFCTVGEEWGFIGSLTVIILLLWLMIRIVKLAERQRSAFARIYGYGLASILFFHFFINIGMTIGITPVIGIPLPFFSYGGSSLWAFTILLFIFLKLDAARLDEL